MARPDDMPRHDDPTELEPRPSPAPPPGETPRGDTSAQLRRDIESGATGDKVAALDPAMSPLGTDDEAAGAPPSPATVAAARRTERARAEAAPHAHDRGGMALGLRIGGAVLFAVALAAIALWISFGV